MPSVTVLAASCVDALHASKSKGFGEGIGMVTANYYWTHLDGLR